MKKLHRAISIGLLSLAPLAMAEEFSTTLKPETLQQAIAWEKAKDRAAALQAQKEAGLIRESTTSQTSRSASNRSRARKTGQTDSSRTQADSSKAEKK